MRRIILGLIIALFPALASAQGVSVSNSWAGNTLAGRVGSAAGPLQAIPFANVLSYLNTSQLANTVFAGPTSGGAALATWRLLVGADLPLPTTSTLGGIASITCSASHWVSTIPTTLVQPTCTQPAFSDISGQATNAQLASDAANTTLGNWTSGSTTPSANAMPSCSGANTLLNYTTNTGIGCKTYAPAATNSTKASVTANNSTSSFTMAGLQGTITPTTTGQILITISGYIAMGASTSAGVGVTYQISYGTGSAPTTNAGLTGTQVGSTPEYTNPAALTSSDVNVPFSISVVVTGLSVGTAYWLDLAQKGISSSGAATFTQVNTSAIEN